MLFLLIPKYIKPYGVLLTDKNIRTIFILPLFAPEIQLIVSENHI